MTDPARLRGNKLLAVLPPALLDEVAPRLACFDTKRDQVVHRSGEIMSGSRFRSTGCSRWS